MFVFNQWVLKIIASTLRTNMNPPLIDDIQSTSLPASFSATFSKADLEKKKGFKKIAVGSLVDNKIKICFSIHMTHPQALTSTYFTDIFHIKKSHMCISTQGRVQRRCSLPLVFPVVLPTTLSWAHHVSPLGQIKTFGIFFLVVLVANSCQVLLQWYPARLLCQWDFPGKNTGVGCHFLLHHFIFNKDLRNTLWRIYINHFS